MCIILSDVVYTGVNAQEYLLYVTEEGIYPVVMLKMLPIHKHIAILH